MTLVELEETLPNGFHDAELISLSVDYRTRVAKLELDIWTGDLHSKDTVVREAYRLAELVISGVAFFFLDPPDFRYGYAKDTTTIHGFEWAGKTEVPQKIEDLVKSLPAGTFYNNAFIHCWNAFLHIAGTHAELRFKDA
jgi:hypothetical protein